MLPSQRLKSLKLALRSCPLLGGQLPSYLSLLSPFDGVLSFKTVWCTCMLGYMRETAWPPSQFSVTTPQKYNTKLWHQFMLLGTVTCAICWHVIHTFGFVAYANCQYCFLCERFTEVVRTEFSSCWSFVAVTIGHPHSHHDCAPFFPPIPGMPLYHRLTLPGQECALLLWSLFAVLLPPFSPQHTILALLCH